MNRVLPYFRVGFRRVALAAGLSLLAACSMLPEEVDVTANWSPNKLYSEAKTAMADGNWEEALKMYQKLESRYPYGAFALQAQMDSAYAHWKNGDPDQALAACDRFIKLHPNHPNVDYLFYLKGLIAFNGDLGFMGYFNTQDQTERDPKSARESFETFKELIRRFPESKYAPDAVERMGYLVNALSAHEVHVARYYFKRGAYLAAANRSQYAIQHYPNTPAQEEALYLLMRSYQALNMEDLRADAERVLRLNFPDSHFFADGLEKKKTWWRVF